MKIRTAMMCIALALVPLAGTTAIACTLEEALGQIKFFELSRRGELAKQATPILEALKKLNAKGTDPKKTVGEQLSQKDVASFSELSQRLKANQLQNLIVSGYGRDADVIGKMFKVADQIYMGGTAPQEGSPEYIYYVFLLVMHSGLQGNDGSSVTVPPKEAFEKCYLDGALHLIENESLTKLNKLPAKETAEYLSALQRKYNFSGSIDQSKLSVEDRATMQGYVRNVLAPAQHEEDFIANIENLKRLTKASVLKYTQLIKVANDSGGDIDAVGRSFETMNLDPKTRFTLEMLEGIAEKVPSDWAKDMQLISTVTSGQQQRAPR